MRRRIGGFEIEGKGAINNRPDGNTKVPHVVTNVTRKRRGCLAYFENHSVRHHEVVDLNLRSCATCLFEEFNRHATWCASNYSRLVISAANALA